MHSFHSEAILNCYHRVDQLLLEYFYAEQRKKILEKIFLSEIYY